MSAFDPKRTSAWFNKFKFTVLYQQQRLRKPHGNLAASGDLMKKFATAIAAIALIGTPAFAADMAVKAAAPSLAAVYNWTGWYAGVNAGASFGNVKTDFNAPFSVIVCCLGTHAATADFDVAGSNTESPSGFIGGGQIGYNWQYSPLIVVGLEADFQGSLEKDSNNNFGTFHSLPSSTFPNDFVTLNTNYTAKIDWFGTVRARIGYVWGNGEVLSYVTGGLAYGKVDFEGAVSGILDNNFLSFSFGQFGHSQVNTGWVVGYGTEGHLPLMPGNWTWKIEGLYMDLGTLDVTSPGITLSCGANCSGITVSAGGQVATHSHFTDGILRGGLNYKFN
jgi:outer membrane immunogenic protein